MRHKAVSCISGYPLRCTYLEPAKTAFFHMRRANINSVAKREAQGVIDGFVEVNLNIKFTYK